MSLVFADSGFFIALVDVTDQLHDHALKWAVGRRDDAIVTTQMALTETLNHVSRRGSEIRDEVGELVGELEHQPGVEIVPQTDEQFRAAVEFYLQRPDKRWSLTDCASFLVMQERGITEALAYDRDFEQAGFVALLRKQPS